ncbi:PIN domain nuclease [Marivirga tractuosa]|uniref:type II toxin-antitoxin system VapC family toxin n=1 Tax=Marivirga tractuosa TaxID=1006 RepID=UPI0035D10BD4
MILIDSSVWIDYFNGVYNQKTDFLYSNLGREEFVIGDLIYAEVLQGFSDDKSYIKAKELLNVFPFKNIGGKEIALSSANNYRILRKKGVTIRKTVDVFIATFCIENNISLLQNHKNFEPFITLFNLKSI